MKKQNKIIIAAVAGVLIALIAGIAVWYFYNQNKEAKAKSAYEQKIKKIWIEVIKDSDGIKKILGNPAKDSDLQKLDDDARILEKSVRRKISELKMIKAPNGYDEPGTKLKKGLDAYAVYLAYLQNDVLYKSIDNIKIPEDIDEAQKYADVARVDFAAFDNAYEFIQERVSDEVFDLSQLRDYIDNWQSKAAEEAEKKAEQAAAAEAAQRAAYEASIKQAAEKTAQDFINGLAGVYQSSPNDLWTGAQRVADQYWTTASINNFTNDYKKYFDNAMGRPTYTGGKIIQSEKVSDSKFNVSAEEGERLDTAPGSPETKYLNYFIVERIGSGWFITSHGRK